MTSGALLKPVLTEYNETDLNIIELWLFFH